MKATQLPALSRDEKIKLQAMLAARAERNRFRLFDLLFPEDGQLSRHAYPKHMEFFQLGATRRERCFLAGNRVGKTFAGGYELACHLTGKYPHWWQGRRFNHPTEALAAGDTLDTTKDIIQVKLLGGSPEHSDWGSGIIPYDTLGDYVRRSGKTGMISEVKVQHVSGGWSTLHLRSYDQGRKIFQGTEKDIIWLDEEVPQDVYEEALVRTMTTHGLVMLTFTPLEGLTALVLEFLPGGDPNNAGQSKSGKITVMAGWDDAPHLTTAAKAELMASLPPHQRDARSKGVPSLGSGAIYPVPESEIIVDPFVLPGYWPRAYGMDVGWNRTAAVWGAIDRESDIVYLYSEHYRGQAEPAVHAAGIRARGNWINGVIDPASRGRGQRDGEQLLQNYIDLGLLLSPAINGVESGIFDVWQRLSTGRLKVFSSLSNWRSEYRIYRRDKKGGVVKSDDHIMDATRYFMTSGLDVATNAPVKNTPIITAGGIIADATTGY